MGLPHSQHPGVVARPAGLKGPVEDSTGVHWTAPMRRPVDCRYVAGRPCIQGDRLLGPSIIASARKPLSRTGLIAASILALSVVAVGAPAVAESTDLDAQGAALVDEFITILKQPDAQKRAELEGFLADEFQIVRSNGAVLDKDGYVANPATVFEVEISDVQAREANGVLVVSYVLSVDEVLEGVQTKTIAPRLSVFHQDPGGEWHIAAHANFGAIEPS